MEAIVQYSNKTLRVGVAVQEFFKMAHNRDVSCPQITELTCEGPRLVSITKKDSQSYSAKYELDLRHVPSPQYVPAFLTWRCTDTSILVVALIPSLCKRNQLKYSLGELHLI